MIEIRKTQEPGKTPAQITVSMIDQDLKDGVSKAEMSVKYGIKPWEVDEMFKHPFLKGRRPSRKKALSFKFIDDVTTTKEEEVEVDPRQVTLEQAIDEAIETVEDAKQEMQEAEKAIVDMLSPTEYETQEEFVEELRPMQVNGLDSDSLNNEKELEMDDDTFEL